MTATISPPQALPEEAQGRSPDPSPGREIFELTRISELIKKALEGTLPRERAPHYWEPRILGSRHINMVLDRAAGYTMTEIAERWDYTSAQVANVMSHPDAQTILSTIAALQAEQLTDIEARFKALAPVALNVKTEILTNPEVNPGVRDRVASDILDRAGYAPRKHVEVDQNHRFFIPAQAATGLKEIMQESMRVSSMNFSKHLQRPDAEVAAEHLQVAEVGHLLPADGASPVPAPVSLESQERVA